MKKEEKIKTDERGRKEKEGNRMCKSKIYPARGKMNVTRRKIIFFAKGQREKGVKVGR
jgi:hypothetical protein